MGVVDALLENLVQKLLGDAVNVIHLKVLGESLVQELVKIELVFEVSL